MEQAFTEQQMMTLPSIVVVTEIPSQVSTEVISTTIVIIEIPPLVTTQVLSNAPSTFSSMVVTEEGSASAAAVALTGISLDTSALISVIAASSSQHALEIPSDTQKEATTPLANPKLPPWMEVVAPKRKKQVISPDEFDFEQLVPPKPKGTKKPKTVSRVLVDPKSKRKYAEVMVPSSDKNKDDVRPEDYIMQTVELGQETHESVKLDS